MAVRTQEAQLQLGTSYLIARMRGGGTRNKVAHRLEQIREVCTKQNSAVTEFILPSKSNIGLSLIEV